MSNDNEGASTTKEAEFRPPAGYESVFEFDHYKDLTPTNLSDKAMSGFICFVHIPKCGGSTLKNFLTYNFGVYYRDHHLGLNDLRTQPDTLQQLRAVSAHRPFGYINDLREALEKDRRGSKFEKFPLFRDPYTFSVTRDPVELFISLYNFVTTFPPHHFHQKCKDMEPDEFFNFYADTQDVFRNTQCRFVAGRTGATAEEAITAIGLGKIRVVDIARQNLILDELIERFGLCRPENFGRANESPKRLTRDFLSPTSRKLIEDCNSEDMRLSEFLSR